MRIVLRHIFPGVVNTVVVVATLNVGGLILTESSLSFLGVGIPPPTPSWGSMVSDGRNYLASSWWITPFPGMAIFVTVIGFNFLGDWLRDTLDPRLRQVGEPTVAVPVDPARWFDDVVGEDLLVLGRHRFIPLRGTRPSKPLRKPSETHPREQVAHYGGVATLQPYWYPLNPASSWVASAKVNGTLFSAPAASGRG